MRHLLRAQSLGNRTERNMSRLHFWLPMNGWGICRRRDSKPARWPLQNGGKVLTVKPCPLQLCYISVTGEFAPASDSLVLMIPAAGLI